MNLQLNGDRYERELCISEVVRQLGRRDGSGWISYIYIESEWKDFRTKLQAVSDEFSICVGTNEDIDYSNGKDLLKKMKVHKLSESDYATISRIFGDGYGEQSAFDNSPIDEDTDWEDEDEGDDK